MRRFAPFFNFSVLLLVLTVLILFKPFFSEGRLPIPSDTIVGLYHPFRDLYVKDYPNGVPFKNFLITDPVRQQYPWRLLAISEEQKGQMPLWNPYSMSGMPLLGSLQPAALYPLNILLFIFPFAIGWSLLILLQPMLAGVFSYFYLRNLGLYRLSSLLGGLVFAFCGFSTAWLEWGTVGHVALWLPLLLLAIDKLFFHVHTLKAVRKPFVAVWSAIFVGALSASFFAGHLQTFFYVSLVWIAYFIARWFQYGKDKKILSLYILLTACYILLTAVQWYPLFQLIGLSARNIDQINWQAIDGWFVPWQHLIQFVAPDFFGNPTTLNYWGVWNYGELVGYIGMVPLVMALYAMFFRRDRRTLFFGTLFFLSLIFALPTIFAKLPYLLHIPLLSTSQPTRLLFITDFTLSVLAALGMDWYIRQEKKNNIIFPVIFVGGVLIGLWLYVLLSAGPNIQVSKHNLYFPTVLFGLTLFVVLINMLFKNKKIFFILIGILLLSVVVDLFRFSQKFTPFTDSSYLFPQTTILTFLQQDMSQFRIMETDQRILPPNFAVMYHLQSIDGYDPLYLRRYAELISASERGKPDIKPPFGFNRIITPENINSRIINLLGVKYVLSFSEIANKQFVKVKEEGLTSVYKNTDAFARAFFVTKVQNVNNKQEAINTLFDTRIDLHTTAIVEGANMQGIFGAGQANIVKYSENSVMIQTSNQKEGFLVVTDMYYPTWHAKICLVDGTTCRPTPLYLTNYTFRGVRVPPGEHSIVFYNSLL